MHSSVGGEPTHLVHLISQDGKLGANRDTDSGGVGTEWTMGKKKKLAAARPATYLTPEPEEARACLRLSCCSHGSCDHLKERGFCREWFFVRWVSSEPLMPSEVLRELRSSLNGRKFSLCGVRKDVCVYEILLRVSPDDPLVVAREILPLDSDHPETRFRKDDSKVWHLSCCWDALKWDARDWVARLRGSQLRTVLGNIELTEELDAELPGGRNCPWHLPHSVDGVVDLSGERFPYPFGH